MQMTMHLPQTHALHVCVDRAVANYVKNEKLSATREFTLSESTPSYGNNIKPRALLVEDDPIIQKVHCKYLENIGFVVDIAGNGKQALALYKRDYYAIVFLDGGLPDINGFEIAKIIRSQDVSDQQQVLIMLSAFDYDDVKEKCQASGINAFAVKPVSIPQLRELVARWLLNLQK
jgi:two-component system sensor histidine kinase/response regulator